jgi:hypothetical protein
VVLDFVALAVLWLSPSDASASPPPPVPVVAPAGPALSAVWSA